MDNQTVSTEVKLLNSLDKCLLKLAQALDEKFDPRDDEDIKLLRSFRIMLESRRKWVREYELTPTPEAVKLSQACSKLNEATPSNGGQRVDRAKHAPVQSPDRIKDEAVDETVQQILAERAQSSGKKSSKRRFRHADSCR